jgi:hypothetical protein
MSNIFDSLVSNDDITSHVFNGLKLDTLIEMKDNTLRLIVKGNGNPTVTGIYKLLLEIIEAKKN